MRNISLRKILAAIAIICLLFSQQVFAEITVQIDNGTGLSIDTPVYVADDDYLQNMMDFIKEYYNGDVNDTELIRGALKGMFSAMDPYTTFYTPEEADKFLGVLGDSIVGIGVALEKIGNYVTVTKTYAGSPAEKAGIYPGDRIATVNGRSIVGALPEEASSVIRGDAGTSVKLGIIKAGEPESNVKEVVLNREKIALNPVTYDIRGDIGYIRLESFSINSASAVKTALRVMDGNKITKIILDLRDNGGGYVDQAVGIAGNFVPRGLVTTLDYKSPTLPDQSYYSTLDKIKYKLAVLVNENTASASEILSGAIQDTASGTLVGTKTFGKAKVQNLIKVLTPDAYRKYQELLGVKAISPGMLSVYGITPSDDEVIGTIKMTTGMYITPKGRMIDLQGLMPDVRAPDPKLVDGINVNSIQRLRKIIKLNLGDSSPDVYNAEKILKLLGYNVDAPDSKLNDKTFMAIQKLQKDNNLHSYGILDYTTQQLLNDKLDRLYAELDGQYAKAVEVVNK